MTNPSSKTSYQVAQDHISFHLSIGNLEYVKECLDKRKHGLNEVQLTHIIRLINSTPGMDRQTKEQRDKLKSQALEIIPPIPPKDKEADKDYHPLKVLDLSQHIGSFLHPKDIGNFAQVNLSCHEIAPVSLMQSMKEKQLISFEQLDAYKKSFKLSNFSQLFSIFKFDFSSNNPSCLEFLDLSYSNIDNIKLMEIIDGCPNLISINLSHCGLITDDAVGALAEKYPNLDWISLFNCPLITDAAVRALANKCPNLTAIYLKNCALITNAAVLALADKCPNLTQINLDGCTLITDVAVIALADKYPKMTLIGLRNCAITDTAVLALADKCPNLTHIYLCLCELITDEAIGAIADKCTNLLSIGLTGCALITDAPIIMLAGNCRNLIQITLARCELITDAAVITITDKRKKLIMIDLQSCPLITDKSIRVLADNCPNLASIYLPRFITDAGVRALADKCPKLKLISLYNCSLITDAAIGAIADKCTNLTLINLYNCALLTDLSYIFLAKYSHKIRGIYGEFPEKYGEVLENVSFWQNLKREFSYAPLTELGRECSKALNDITSTLQVFMGPSRR